MVFIPEISDYELRRELIRAGLSRGIERLNGFKRRLHYLPITTATMKRAAEMWADARSRGLPTADPKELDGDVILAAQAERAKAIVATDNVSHLSRFIEAGAGRISFSTRYFASFFSKVARSLKTSLIAGLAARYFVTSLAVSGLKSFGSSFVLNVVNT